MVKIHCLEVPAHNNGSYSFEVKFEQINPHRIFKFILAKTRDELMRLYVPFTAYTGKIGILNLRFREPLQSKLLQQPHQAQHQAHRCD